MATLGLLELPAPSADVVRRSTMPFVNRRLAGMSLLEWVVRRITDCAMLDQVAIIAASEQQASLIDRFTPADVPVVTSAAPDPLGRFVDVARLFSVTAVVRFQAAHPLVDPSLVDRLVASAQTRSGLDYASFSSRIQSPSKRRRLSPFGEWCRMSALEEADRLASTELERLDVTRYLWSHPRLFQLGWTPMPQQLDRDDVRLIVDVEEDWDHVHQIVEALGGDNLDWRTVADLLAHQPVMRGRMERLNQADEAALAAAVR